MAREERIASNAKVPEDVLPLVSDQCNALSSYRRCERMNRRFVEMRKNYFKYSEYNLAIKNSIHIYCRKVCNKNLLAGIRRATPEH